MLRFIISAVILIAGMVRVLACGPYDRYYTQDSHTTFRIFASHDAAMPTDRNIQQMKFRKENLRLWQELSSPRIPQADIDSVVYSWDMSRLAQLAKAAKDSKAAEKAIDVLCKNAFAKWIVDHKDSEAAQYLLLAKDCERVMKSQNSLWYYYVEGDEQTTLLAGKARKDAASYKGTRLADRYALLRIRALFASKHYGECIKVWETQKQVFSPGAIHDKAEGYAAGAYAMTGKEDRARKIYTRLHDYESILALDKVTTTADRLSVCASLWPDDTYTLSLLQQEINEVEEGLCFWWEEDDAKIYTNILKTVKKALRHRNIKSRAEWNYAAAFLEEKLGHKHQALSYLRKAQKCNPNADLNDAMRVLGIYIHVKYSKVYDDRLEKWLVGELNWIAEKAKSNLTPQKQQQLKMTAMDDVNIGFSIYYWDDMMRKIVLGQVVPLCVRSHYNVRALQYANMGENHLSHIIHLTDGSERWRDYRNDYFLNLDSLGVKSVERLIYRMQNPESPTDTLVSRYGYTSMPYLYEIAGTQMIASMRYREAVKYLSKVPAAFLESTNYESTRDPFDPKKMRWQKEDKLYKQHFAQKMAALEEKMRSATNPNDRAEAMLEYVAGLENSVTRCWSLTSYYWGDWSNYPMYSRNFNRRIDNIVNRSKKLKRKAFKMFTDKERASNALCNFCMFKTAARLYPDTRSGRLVRSKCDVLKDYTTLNRTINRREVDYYWCWKW